MIMRLGVAGPLRGSDVKMERRIVHDQCLKFVRDSVHLLFTM